MKEIWMHITEWKKPVWKGYILYDSNCVTFWKRQNFIDSKKTNQKQWLLDLVVLGRWIDREQKIFRAMKKLYNNIMMMVYMSLYICSKP